MTLGRLVLAWLPVAFWFVAVGYGRWWLDSRLRPELGAQALPLKPLVGSRLVEAGVLTLIASLWFDSLGHGGWWLLFLLFGALVALPGTLSVAGVIGSSRRLLVQGVAIDCARYVVAGGILAWRLG